MLAVGRPGIHVDGSLPAEKLEDGFRIAPFCGAVFVGAFAAKTAAEAIAAGHEAQFHVLVWDVFAGLYVGFVVGDHDDFLLVWGDVREPCVPMFVVRHLSLSGAIRFHAPCLHATCAYGVEPDVFAVAVVFGTIVQAASCREARLVSACSGDGVDVVFAIAFSAVSKRFSVGRNSVEVAWCKGRYEHGQATVEEDFVDARKSVFFCVVAYVEAASVWGEDVVVVAVVYVVAWHFDDIACGDVACSAAFQVQFVNASVAVVGEKRAVCAPVGSLDDAVEFLECLHFACFNVENLQDGLVAATVPGDSRSNFKGEAYAKAVAQ